MTARPPHLANDCYSGYQRVFLTMCTFGRREYFVDRACVELILDQLLHWAALEGVEVIAYCFMPDHLHVLLAGCSDQANVRKCAERFRQAAGYRFRRRWGTRLWQEGYFDRLLRDEDATLDVVRYIVANPVRAGLCETVGAYPYSGSSGYTIAQLADAVQWRPCGRRLG